MSVKSQKLIAIEQKAWTEFNVNSRRRDSKIMDWLQTRWNKEVQKLTGPQSGFVRWTVLRDTGETFCYYFEDVLA